MRLGAPRDADRVTEDVAAFLGGVFSLERLRAIHGADVLDILDEAGWVEAERRAAQAESDGTATRARSREILGQAIRRIGDLIDSGEVSPSTLIKAAELLSKLAGLSMEPEPVRGQFSINIVLSTDRPKRPLTIEAKAVRMKELPDVD